MIPLPIDEALPEIVELARGRRCLVLVAPPGAGKTTRVPVALLQAGLLSADHPALVMLQPRRVAARAAAARIAEDNGWTLGGRVGYQVRFDKRVGPETRLKVVTEGLLNRQLVGDPFLEGVGAVVLDEFHERSLHTDLALALLREARDSVREDLILVVMSATMEAEPVARFLGDAPIVRVDGRSYPVEVRYRGGSGEPLPAQVARAVEEAVANDPDRGDLLAFLPGVEEIRRTARELAGWASREGFRVLPLHGSLTAEEQDQALRPGDRRKVILATNIAETSLTIDGVTTVVDSGLARYASHDPTRGLDRLELGRISRASSDQRAGRAGRTRPGRCVRLWTDREQRGLLESDVPEVRRVDLCGTILALHAWGHADPSKFAWYEAPEPESLRAAERLLATLGAIDGEGGAITPLGHRLLEIPTHPRVGRLLIASAAWGCLREGAAIAALLSEKDLLARGFGPTARPEVHASSDVLVRLDRLDEAERARFAPGLRDRGIDPIAARQVAKVRDDLLRLGRRLAGPARVEPTEDDLLRLILLAYPDRVVRRRGGDGSTGLMVGGRGVRLDPESVVREAEFYLGIDPREDRRGGTLEARVRVASAIRLEWLDELFPDGLTRALVVEYDEARGRVVKGLTLSYRGLALREDRSQVVDPREAGEALGRALAPRGRSFFEGFDVPAAWLARLDLARRVVPEANWPGFEPDDWAELIATACLGKRSEAEVQAGGLLAILKARLTYAQNQALDELIPEALEVPSGNKIRLSYPADGPPFLEVRLQELFGWSETPKIARGRLSVVLHLLGPNYRPVQITGDLASFWSSAYFQVRKDLRSRYPKHSWPDDPLNARAEARGGRRVEASEVGRLEEGQGPSTALAEGLDLASEAGGDAGVAGLALERVVQPGPDLRAIFRDVTRQPSHRVSPRRGCLVSHPINTSRRRVKFLEMEGLGANSQGAGVARFRDHRSRSTAVRNGPSRRKADRAASSLRNIIRAFERAGTPGGGSMADRGSRDDFELIRLRGSGRTLPDTDLSGGGVPAFVGQVTSTGSSIAIGCFLMVQPTFVLGPEVEGGPGLLTSTGAPPVAVYLLGPAKALAGDYLACRYVDNRWVAERTVPGHGGGMVGVIPNCFCTTIPASLSMTSGDSNCNYKMFQSCSIKYGATPAGYAALNLLQNTFLSTNSFPNPILGGAMFQYYLTCQYNQFSLTRVYLQCAYGSPYQDGVLYSWVLGGYGNTCTPFHLDNGVAFPGSDASCSVTIDGA